MILLFAEKCHSEEEEEEGCTCILVEMCVFPRIA